MADKKKYYKLDDIGMLGKQEKKTSASERYHFRKTGEVFRQFKEDHVAVKSSRKRKVI